MTLLELVQSAHYEAKQPGSPPSTTAGQTGRAADFVRWVIEAYNDIQREKDGRWKWLRGSFYVDTVADTASYAYGDCTDVDAAAAISRFRAWDLDEREPPLIYLSSDGASTERELVIQDWPRFRYLYVRATHDSAYPGDVSVDAADNLYLGPTPDDVYRVTGNYWKSNQTLADDADTPEMPSDYHMLIPYRALLKYGYNAVAQEVLARIQVEGADLYEALKLNQAYSRFSLSVAGPLA